MKATSLEHAPCRPPQRERIFSLLDTAAAHNQEVPAFELATISLQYCARLKELQDLGEVHGFRILNRVEHQEGRVLGYYKLVWDRPRPTGFSITTAATPPSLTPHATMMPGETLPLFAGPAPQQWCDPEEGGLR